MNAGAKNRLKCGGVCLAIFLGAISLAAAASKYYSTAEPEFSPDEVLSARQWNQVDAAVDRSLAWLASQQRRDGSFPTIKPGQPAVTSLCILAFLADGHRPGEGPYGQNINAGIDFVLSCQKANGLFCYQVPEKPYMKGARASRTYPYNHAISGVMLGEVYGMTDRRRADRIRVAIDRALRFTYQEQKMPKKRRGDLGGWRYHKPPAPVSADLSVTSWHLMFLRSVQNAGFNVPKENVDEGLGYVQRCFDRRSGMFRYIAIDKAWPRPGEPSRSMTGAGILSLSLGGMHETEMARRAGDWLLKHPFDRYNESTSLCQRFHYGAFYCSQAMYQLGGKYWAEFYPVLVHTCLANQRPDGSWDSEARDVDSAFGNAYTSSLIVLALTTPYQLLPIFQR